MSNEPLCPDPRNNNLAAAYAPTSALWTATVVGVPARDRLHAAQLVSDALTAFEVVHETNIVGEYPEQPEGV